MIRKPLLLLAGIVGWCGVSLLWAQPPAASNAEPAERSVIQEKSSQPQPVTGGKKPTASPVAQSDTSASGTNSRPHVSSSGRTASASQVSGNATGQESKVVDFTADLMRPVKVGDSSALSLVGHVVFHHNGAVITCDSAIRYNDRQMDCFQNVIINQDTIFIYGDRVEYNGFINTARVYAPLIKVVDKDAVFYTYNFSFNTLDNIGHYTGGGTMLQGENRLESQEGFYYVNDRILVGVDDVEMENPDYRMRADSVSYNLNAEIASFYTRSYIWNSDDEFLTAVRGQYDRKQEKYTFTDSSYILTASQEVWADTLIYEQPTGDALLLSNVQVVDEEQKALAFGDYVQYWGQERKALLTRNPVIASYETQTDSLAQNQDSLATDSIPRVDTLYMRADSMFLYTVNRFDTLASDSLSQDTVVIDSIGKEDFEALPAANETTEPDSDEGDGAAVTPTDQSSEEVGKENLPESQSLSLKEQKKIEKQQRKEAQRQAREEARRLKREKRRAALLEKMAKRAQADSMARADSLAQIDSLKQKALVDSLANASTDTLSLVSGPDSVVQSQDSLLRQLFAYHNVKIYRTDFQAVCDSMAGFTLDSTLHMYINPVLWNDKNQVTASTVDIYTRNQMIQRAVFVGDPIMSSQVDSIHYNQIKGREIQSYFHDGKMFRTDVNGNGQTYYYMEDQDSLGRYITGFMTMESANISFYFEDQQIVQITWREGLNYQIYPIEKIPETISQTLPGFKWEGDRRPSLTDVFDRTVRPSLRDYYRSIDKPTYPITEKIDRYREQLIKEGSWRDRNDPLSEEAVEFLRSLQTVTL